jgi:hypothetical protein
LEIEKADYIERVLELDSQNILQKNKTFADSYADIEKNKEKFNLVVEKLLKAR